MTECPNHQGAFDCTPFCEICEGEQEYDQGYDAGYKQAIVDMQNSEKRLEAMSKNA